MESGKGTLWGARHPTADTCDVSADRIFCGWSCLGLVPKQIPPLSLIDLGLIEYIFLPGLFSWFFTKQLLDGKAPHRFFYRAAQYYLSPRRINRYKEVSEVKAPYKYKSSISYRKLSYQKKDGEVNEHRISR